MQQEPRDLNQHYAPQQQPFQNQQKCYQQLPPIQQHTGAQKHSALQQNSSPQQSASQHQIAGQQQPQQNLAEQPHSLTAEPSANYSFSAYGAGIRKQVFELVVQQALTGASWRDVCATHMRINLISPQEVEQEVQRRTIARQPKSLQHAWLEHKARLNSIKHSEQSPCPCNSCIAQVLKMREFKFAPSRRI